MIIKISKPENWKFQFEISYLLILTQKQLIWNLGCVYLKFRFNRGHLEMRDRRWSFRNFDSKAIIKNFRSKGIIAKFGSKAIFWNNGSEISARSERTKFRFRFYTDRGVLCKSTWCPFLWATGSFRLAWTNVTIKSPWTLKKTCEICNKMVTNRPPGSPLTKNRK